jgi:hypothetical protein
MKRLLLLLMVVVATWVGVTWGGVTASGASPFKFPQQPPKQLTKFKFQGENAYAEFHSTEGCMTTYANVGAGESVSKVGPGKPVVYPGGFVSLVLQNSCTGEGISGLGDSSLSADAFSMQSNLQSATLNAVVQLCCDQSGSSFPVSVNLTWTGTGSISTGKSSETSKSPGCKITRTSQGDSRPAVATGSIMALGTEFASQPTTSASLSSTKDGLMEVGCN